MALPIAAVAGLVIANFGLHALQARGQRAASKAQNKIDAAQAMLQTEEMLAARTQDYAQNMAYALAQSAMGVGGLTGFRQGVAMGSDILKRDLRAGKAQLDMIKVGALSQKAGYKTGALTTIGSGAISSISLANELKLFSGGK